MEDRIRGIIDRLEGNKVIVEIGEDIISLPKDKFPLDTDAGDSVEIIGNTIKILKGETPKSGKESQVFRDSILEDS